MIRNEKGELVELGHSSFSRVPALAERDGAQEGVPHVLRAVRRPQEHDRRGAERLGAARRVLRQGPRTTTARWSRRCSTTTCRCSVYDNLIASVHRNLPALYRYYDLRRRAMKLKDIHQYDTYVPIFSDVEQAAHRGTRR